MITRRPHDENGQVVSRLADWIVPEDWLYLYFRTRRYISAGLRPVIEMSRN
jgi:DNA-binding transcriptional LysR family regulator